MSCEYLINGRSGARMYYGLSDWPNTLEFTQPLDLHALTEGRFTMSDDGFSTNVFPLRADEQRPQIDFVLIKLPQGITPALNVALPAYGLSRDDGDALEVLSRVANDRAFQLAPSNAHYINFARSTARLGDVNTYHGNTYSFPGSRIDPNEEREAIRRMFCAGWVSGRSCQPPE